jgi:hypothetical protein
MLTGARELQQNAQNAVWTLSAIVAGAVVGIIYPQLTGKSMIFVV